jgi:transcription elongation factor Elf1
VKNKPLVERVYKYKNKERNFFCPLCRTERNVTTSPKLTKKNIAQITLTSIMIGAALYPFVGVNGFVVFFAVWGFFELAIRSDYKKQIACPHCGFDASAYKRDVRVARQQVADFWAQKQTVIPAVSEASAKRT